MLAKGSPVDGRADPLHQDIGRQALRIFKPLHQLIPVQIIAATLSLRLEHIVVWPSVCQLEHLLRLGVLQVVQAPQPCSTA